MNTFRTQIVSSNPLDLFIQGFGSSPHGHDANLVDRYFRDHSWRLHQFGFVRSYRVNEDGVDEAIGLFALSCGSLLLRGSSAAPLLKDPVLRQEFVYMDGTGEYAVAPTIHINYLALNRPFQGRIHPATGERYSTMLMLQAFVKAAEVSTGLGAMFLELDALDERAFRTYYRLGFRSEAGGLEDLEHIVFDAENDDLPKMMLPISRVR